MINQDRPISPEAAYCFSDFTESYYREVLDLAAAKYRFAHFSENLSRPHVLWRHDIDASVHRARRLATIEAERGLRSTFFFMLGSPFYNLFETHTLRVAKDITDAGHWVGLHFSTNDSEHSSRDIIEQKAEWERNVLSDLLGADTGAISFHDPTPEMLSVLNVEKIAGMANVYGSAIRTQYHYCSDSNGYWRYQRLFDLLRDGQHPRLHVLTHPEWWTPDAMSPRQRIVRCVEGRAMATLRSYDLELERDGRENIS